jgi:hypothetical protein
MGNKIQFVIYDKDERKLVAGDSVFVIMDDGYEVELTLGCEHCASAEAHKTPLPSKTDEGKIWLAAKAAAK